MSILGDVVDVVAASHINHSRHFDDDQYTVVLYIRTQTPRSMKAEVHFIRRHGIKMAERDAAGTRSLVGDLMLDEHWDNKTRAVPALMCGEHNSKRVPSQPSPSSRLQPK